MARERGGGREGEREREREREREVWKKCALRAIRRISD